MPPPITPVGRKATPGGGRGSRRGQGTTPRVRKPRASNKVNQGGLKTIFPITADPSQFTQQFQHQQHQIIIQQQPQQQQQQHAGFPKSVTISGVLNASPNQYESVSISNSMVNNIPQSTITTSSSITAPKVVVVSSAPSLITSSTMTTKPITTQITTSQATQILRQNLMSVSVPSSAMSSYGGSMRLPNIPQVVFHQLYQATLKRRYARVFFFVFFFLFFIFASVSDMLQYRRMKWGKMVIWLPFFSRSRST